MNYQEEKLHKPKMWFKDCIKNSLKNANIMQNNRENLDRSFWRKPRSFILEEASTIHSGGNNFWKKPRLVILVEAYIVHSGGIQCGLVRETEQNRIEHEKRVIRKD